MLDYRSVSIFGKKKSVFETTTLVHSLKYMAQSRSLGFFGGPFQKPYLFGPVPMYFDYKVHD